MGRAFGAVHGKNPAGSKTDPIGERQNTLAEFSFLEGFELIEPWRDESREDNDHQKLEAGNEDERAGPPEAARSLHQPKDDEKKGYAEHQPKHQAFELVNDIEPRGYLVEPELRFQSEG